jgi:peptide/nickel transport system substrate-binding protein
MRPFGTFSSTAAPLLAAVALLGAVAGCAAGSSTSSGPSSKPGVPVSGGNITYAELPGATPNFIFPMYPPAANTNANTVTFQYLIHPPMYWFGQGTSPTFNATYSLANAPVYSNNDTVVTVNLKHWKWSNGEALDAADVMFWMNMLKADQTAWGNFSPGDFPDNVKNVTTTGKYTVVFDLTRSFDPTWFTYNQLAQVTPMPIAWDITSTGAAAGSGGCAAASYASVTYNPSTYAPISKTAKQCNAVYDFLANQSGFNPNNPTATNTGALASFATNPLWRIVDGPWYLSAFQPDGYAAFKPNPSYGGPKPHAAQFTTEPFTSNIAEYNALAAGAIDVGYLPPEDVTSAPAKPGEVGANVSALASKYNLLVTPSWSVGYVLMNFNSTGDGGAAGSIFRQLYFRQAFESLVDQPAYVDKIFHNYAYPIYGPVPPNPPIWASPGELKNPYPYNPAKATSLLTSHGWKVVPGGVTTCTRPGTGAGECGAGIAAGTPLTFSLEYPSGSASITSLMDDEASSWKQAGITLKFTAAGANTVFAYTTACPKGCPWEFGYYGAPSWFFGGSDTLPTGESIWNTGGGANYSNYDSPTTNALINATNQVPLSQFRNAFNSYQNYLADQLPAFWEPNTENLIETVKNLQIGPQSPLAEINPGAWYFTK